MSTIQSVKGIVALVTGGSSGLGLATVQRLIKQGAKGIVAFDLNFNDQISKSSNILPIKGDVTSEEDVQKALDQCKQTFGRLDVAVNCAGIGIAERVYHFGKRKVGYILRLNIRF